MTARARRRERRSILIGLVVVALLGGVLAFALRANEGLPVGDFVTARAVLDDVGPLLVGDEVRVNSVRAGRVEAIELNGRRAVVTMKLEDGREIYRDASARLLSRSGLGQKFIDLDPGSAETGELGPDEVIDTDRTQEATELDTLLDVFDEPTRAAVRGAVRELGAGTAGHGQDINDFLATASDLLPDLGTTSRALSGNRANLPGLLQSAERLHGRFSGREEDISALIDQFDQTVRGLAVDEGAPLASAIDALPDTLDRGRAAFRALDVSLPDTRSALAGLRPGAQALGATTPDLRGVLTESRQPLDKVPGVADTADPAVQDLTETFADLRPLAPQVATALERARTPLGVLGTYSGDIAQFFTDVGSALSQGDGDKHWLRLNVVLGTETGSGVVPGAEDPTVSRDPYPEPGTVRDHRETGVQGER